VSDGFPAPLGPSHAVLIVWTGSIAKLHRRATHLHSARLSGVGQDCAAVHERLLEPAGPLGAVLPAQRARVGSAVSVTAPKTRASTPQKLALHLSSQRELLEPAMVTRLLCSSDLVPPLLAPQRLASHPGRSSCIIYCFVLQAVSRCAPATGRQSTLRVFTEDTTTLEKAFCRRKEPYKIAKSYTKILELT